MTDTFLVIPFPDIVTVALRELVEVFSLVVVTVAVPLFEPLDGETLNQEALSLADQFTLELTLIWSLFPEAAPSVRLDGDTVRVEAAPFWVTETFLVIPFPDIVTVADREFVEVFSLVAVTVTVPLFAPLDGETLNQEAFSLADQLTFELTDIWSLLPEAEPKDKLDGETVSVEAAPFWVIDTFLVIPFPDIVTVPLREFVDVFSLVAVTVTVPLFDPLDGDTLNQEALSLADQLTFELTDIWSLLPEAAPKDKLDGETVSVEAAPFWVTETFLVIPFPDIVTVADREFVDVFSLVAVTVTVPLFDPLDGDTLNQEALSLADQLTFELTDIWSLLPEAAPKDKLDGLTVKEAAAPFWVTETFLVIPFPDIVTVADREFVDVFSLVAVTVTVPLFDPLDGDTLNQEALSLADQLTFELTDIWSLLPEAAPNI